MSKNKDNVAKPPAVKLEVPKDYISPYKHNEIFIKNIMAYSLEPGHSLAIYTKYDLKTSSEVITVLFTKEDITRFCNGLHSNVYVVKWMVNETAKVKLKNTSISECDKDAELDYELCNLSLYMHV